MKYILLGILLVIVLGCLVAIKIALWGIPIADMIHQWKYYGRLPEGVNLPQPIPIDCLDSKNMSSQGCLSNDTNLNEYDLPDKLLFT
jgi:hypothetical protein